MVKCIVPDDLLSQLAQSGQSVQLCDRSGRVFGTFLPAIDLDQYEPLEPDLSDEELSEIEKSSKWHTTAEVLRHLENLKEDTL